MHYCYFEIHYSGVCEVADSHQIILLYSQSVTEGVGYENIFNLFVYPLNVYLLDTVRNQSTAQ